MSDSDPDLPVSIGRYSFTRRELYDKVWSTPIAVFAEQIDVSDQAVAKACRRAGVPSPPRGYWAKLAAGKMVTQAAFVETDPRARPLPRKPAPDPTKATAAWLASFAANRQRPDPPPPVPDPPLTEVAFGVARWSWDYHVGEQGEAWTDEAEDYDVWLEWENITLFGSITSPSRWAGKSIAFSVQPAAPKRRFTYSDLDRAHIGILDFEKERLFAEVWIPQSAASRLLQVMISGRPLKITLGTEPAERADTMIIATMGIELR